MEVFNRVIYLVGSIITIISIVICIALFFCKKSKNEAGERIELYNKTLSNSWKLGTWIAGVFVAGTGVALMYAPVDLIGFVDKGLNPFESITMLALLNGAPVWALYSVAGLWYMKHMDSKVGKLAAMLSTILGMSISLWTGMNTVERFIGFNFPGVKFMLAFVTVAIAIISAKNDLLKSMSKLAFTIFLIAFLALISTPITTFTLSPIKGHITPNFAKEYFSGETSASWIYWFLSWTPTVARWLAHISNGRTMKEYIAGTMIIPTVIAFIWMAVSWVYQEVIISFNLATNIASIVPCTIFIISGMLFMAGTLDSDCKVFTEDLYILSRNKMKKEITIYAYGIFVLFFFSLFISGIITNPFAFNEYSSLIFMPLMIAGIVECFTIIRKRENAV